MRINIGWFFILVLCIGGVSVPSYSQSKRKKKKIEILTDSLPDDIVINIFDFKNVNKIPEYRNPAKEERLYRLEQKRDWVNLHRALKDYVGNFGIQNFYKDTYWIWKLAKLTELFEGNEEAKPIYRLALRHHHAGISIRELEIYYDSLSRQEADLFVPIDYYYQLVEHRKAIDTLRPPTGCTIEYGDQSQFKKS